MSARHLAHTLADGRRVRVIVVVDDFARECLALVLDTSLSGRRVVRELDRLVELRGPPLMIVSDEGTDLTSHANAALAGGLGVKRHFIAVGKPQTEFAARSRRDRQTRTDPSFERGNQGQCQGRFNSLRLAPWTVGGMLPPFQRAG